MENQTVTTVVAIDLSAAFDTVDDRIMLDVLEKRYKITRRALA